LPFVRFFTPVIAAPPLAGRVPAEWGWVAVRAGWLGAGLGARCGRRAGLGAWCARLLAIGVVLVTAGIDFVREDAVDDDLLEPQPVAASAIVALAPSTVMKRRRFMTCMSYRSGEGGVGLLTLH
jgi:hypothetical protein